VTIPACPDCPDRGLVPVSPTCPAQYCAACCHERHCASCHDSLYDDLSNLCDRCRLEVAIDRAMLDAEVRS
jgi:RecJ-like exonuclease